MLSPGAKLGPYEVVELLGAGGMGEVYRARDPRLGREVAVKVLPSDVAAEADRLQRFEREAKAVAALNHPHILTVYDVGTADGRPYVVTELLEGENLREILTRRTPTQRQVLGFAVQAAQGLAAAHRKGVVHRDLKPENLFLTTEGRLKILDFGLAKLTAPEKAGDTTGTTDAAPTRPGVLMGTVAYMSPEQVQALPVDARSDIFSFGVVLYELLSRRHPFRRDTAPATLTAILHDTPPELGAQATGLVRAASGIVGRCLEKRREERFQTSHDLALALEAVLHAPTGSAALLELEERSPYPGLQSFTEKDAGVFFGREDEVEELWRRIRSRKLLAVIGPSGVGKTSFVRAGVVAHRPTGWDALVATPGAQPFRGLGRALGPELAGDTEALARLVDCADTETAFHLLSRWRKGREEALIVLDQFEELFTLNPPEAQEGFAKLLGRLVSEANVHVLVSLRDDFLIRCQDRPELAPVFERLTPLVALTGDRLHRALVEPAKTLGYRFEDDSLVGEMVASVEGSRAALPLLAFAMSRLWEKRDREKKLLRREAYEAIGGVGGALAMHADETLERIGHERQGLVREMFRNLVTSEGTRAVVGREELLSVFADQRDAAEKVLATLVDSRLLTSYEIGEGEAGKLAPGREEAPESEATADRTGHRVEIVHESLLKAWPRLVRWQAQDQEGAVLRDQLKQAARLWEEKSRSPDVLWSGTALQEFELWRQRYPGKLTSLEEGFAGAMLERQKRRRLWRRVTVASVVFASLAVAAVVGVSRQQAVHEAERADRAARIAEANQLVALAELRLDEDPTEALALTTASLELADTQEARLSVVRALSEGPPAREVSAGGAMRANAAHFSADGQWLAAGGPGNEVRVWPSSGGGPLVLSHEGPPSGWLTGRWADSRHLVTGVSGWAERLHVWALPEGTRLRTIDLGGRSAWPSGMNGNMVAATLEGAAEARRQQLLLRSWRLPEGEAELLGRVSYAVSEDPSLDLVAFEPNGRGWIFTRGRDVYFEPLPSRGAEGARLMGRHADTVDLLWEFGDTLVSHDEGGESRIWSFPPGGPRLERVIPRPPNTPSDVYAEPSGRWLYPLDFDENTARLWDSASLPGARPLEMRRRGSWANSRSDIGPRGDWIVVTTEGGSRLTFWPLAGPHPSVVDGYSGRVRPLAFSHDSRWLAAAAWAGSAAGVRLWPLPGTPSETVEVLGAEGAANLVFDPNGRFLVRAGGFLARDPVKGLDLLPLDGSPSRHLPGSVQADALFLALAVSPSGRRVATAFTYGRAAERTLRVWDVETGERHVFDLPSPASSEMEPGYRQSVLGLAFADESTLYTAGDGGVRRWDLDTGSYEPVWDPEPQRHLSMAVSSEGQVALTGVSFVSGGCHPVVWHDLVADDHRAMPEFGACVKAQAIDPSGRVAATGDQDGVIRVGRVSGGAPHLLIGHEGPVDDIAVSPDLRWVASTGEDDTLRLWPMPDLDKPPLHTLPHEELIAKLKSLTNIRGVRDPDAPNGWAIELGPFPGWADVPTW